MSNLENALAVSSLTRTIVDMQEKKERLERLNGYDHEETGTAASSQSFSIEIGGGSTHVKYFPKDNAIADHISSFFTDLFDKIEAEADGKLSELLAS